MNKKPIAIYQTIDALTLYLDDIKEISLLFKNELGSFELFIQDSHNNYEITEIEDIAKLNELNISKIQLSEVKGYNENIYISLLLRPGEISLHLSEESVFGRGIWEKPRKFLEGAVINDFFIMNQQCHVLCPSLV